MPAQSVNVIVCSPPYWPPKELMAKIGALVSRRRCRTTLRIWSRYSGEARRVLRDDGVLWVVIDDAYMHRRNLYGNHRTTVDVQS